MKEVSKLVPLKDVCLDFIVPQRDKPTAFDGNIPWCRIEDIEGRYLNGSKSGQNVTKELADKMNMHLCPKGTVISACSASIGNQAITTINCYTNQTFIGLVVNPDLLYNVYLYYFLESQTNNLLKLAQGATIKYISKDKYKRMLIPLPSLSEQQSIVEYLDSSFAKIDTLKANAAKNLDEAKALFQSALKEALEPQKGWEIKTLGQITISMADGPFGSNLKKEHYTTVPEVRIIQLSNIGEEGWREENTKYTTFAHLETIKRSQVEAGNLVIAKMMPAGRAILCPDKEKAYVLSSDVVKAVLINTLCKEFILYQINSPYFRNQVYENVSGSGRVRTSLTKLRDCILQIPPLSKQQEIVSYLDSLNEKVNTLQQNYSRICSECDALKQAILRQVFE